MLHSVARRGEAMRILEKEAGLNIARIDAIQRQKGRYKRAVELVSLGDTIVDTKKGLTGMLAGFDLLDRMGKIKEISSEERHTVLAKQYLDSIDRKQSPLIIAPTHAEGDVVTQTIRDELRRRGAIGIETQKVGRLLSLNLSSAEKSEPSTFAQEGMQGEMSKTMPEGMPEKMVVQFGLVEQLLFSACFSAKYFESSPVQLVFCDKLREIYELKCIGIVKTVRTTILFFRQSLCFL